MVLKCNFRGCQNNGWGKFFFIGWAHFVLIPHMFPEICLHHLEWMLRGAEWCIGVDTGLLHATMTFIVVKDLECSKISKKNCVFFSF
jgi:hypothetical protein